VDKWFYAGWAIRQSDLRLLAYMGGCSGTSVQRAVLQKSDAAPGPAGAAFLITPMALLLKPWPDLYRDAMDREGKGWMFQAGARIERALE
jgi:hypothetical protein